MTLVKEEFTEALLPGIREWFSIAYKGIPSMRERLFNVQPSGSDSEYFHSFGAVSPDAFDNFEKSGMIPTVSFDRGYKTTFTHKEYPVKLPIRRTLLADNKYATVLDQVQQLATAAARKRERDAASVFNNYSSSSYAGGDGVALGSNSHPLSPHKSATTQSNLYASTALSATNVETVRQAMMAYTDDVGEIVGTIPDLLLVPPALENTAKTICETEGIVGYADNDINPQRGRFSYIMWPLLSSATTWFLIDSAMMKQSLFWFEREAPQIDPEDSDQHIWITYIANMRYSYGWRDWRWIGCAAA